jgi:hypothetical protein
VSRYILKVGTNIHEANFADCLTVIQAQPMGCSRSPIVRANIEALMPYLTHNLPLVLSHGPKRVILMAAPSFRLARIAIASEVGQNNGEPFREAAGDFVPNDMRLGIAV